MGLESWEELIGDRIGPDQRYVIRRRLGQGGMGVVYEAWEEEKGRSVAIKFLSGDAGSDPETLQRFKREGSRFNKLRHPNIVRVYGMGRARGLLYIASEFVDGRDLYDHMQERRFDIDEALSVVEAVASGLAVAHEHGIIHRDLKPENVMITRAEGQVKVLDFGIAKDLNASVALTIRGAYLGTPAYSAPEQIRGEDIDGRADIFSLGVILYELVTGETPFKGRRATEVLANTIKVNPVNPSRINRDVEAPVARLIASMIQKKARNRISSCVEVKERVAQVRQALLEPATEEEKRGVVGFLKSIFTGES
ncbi:MAG: serine/threonine protein kinase [Planctomycetes bacterium]|nr:serine/threonine protein kinase [Planctomycetota bacterium]